MKNSWATPVTILLLINFNYKAGDVILTLCALIRFHVGQLVDIIFQTVANENALSAAAVRNVKISTNLIVFERLPKSVQNPK